MATDVMKVLNDLKYKAVGVDPDTKQMPQGYFVSFRDIGLPIPKDDFHNPWTPTGSNMKEILESKPKKESQNSAEGKDPATVESPSVSSQLEDIEFKTANIGASMQAYLQTFMLTDNKLVMEDTYRVAPGTSKLSDTWYAIINGANGIAPDLELNDDMKAAIKRAESVLMDEEGNSTRKYEKYMERREEYKEAVMTRDRMYASALTDPMRLQMWPIQGKLYQDEVEFKWNNWQGLGFKQEIEEALAVLSSQGIDPAILLISRSKNKFENSLINIPNVGNIPYTFITPSKWYSDTMPSGWNTYSKTDFHTESHVDTRSSSTSAAASFSLGFFSIGGSGSASEKKTDINIQTEGLTISFEYAIADIQRPWLDTTLLNLNNWFLVGDYPKGCISNGSFSQQFQQNDPKEMLFMPSVVKSLILARNVKISWRRTESDLNTLQTAVSGGGAVGFGPFFAAGRHSESHGKRDYSFDRNTEGIEIRGTQLIGYVSEIMPSSPRKNGADFMQKKKADQPVDSDSPSQPTS